MKKINYTIFFYASEKNKTTSCEKNIIYPRHRMIFFEHALSKQRAYFQTSKKYFIGQ